MGKYIVKRLMQSVIVIFGVTICAFGLLYLTGDPTLLVLGDSASKMSAEEIAAFRVARGFDRPWIVQYGEYMWNVLHGDLGTSYYYLRPNIEVIGEAFPKTAQLAVSAVLMTMIIAIPLGILSATHKNTWIDRFSMGFGLLGQSLPVFFLGLFLILIFAVKLRWFPVSGYGSLKNFVLPTIALGLFSCAQNARMVRSCMLEVMGQDYMRTAESKGISKFKVIFKHGLRNALMPIVTMFSMEFAELLGGAVITENIFAWPGIGQLCVRAINTKDIPLVQSCIIVISLIFIVINLLTDILYVFLDPKARLK